MATATGISIEEYLGKSYEPDCDYVDGELEDRNVGQRDHSYLQAAISGFFFALRRRLGCHVFTEQRMRVSKTRVRLPDVCVVLGPYPEEPVFTKPPFLCIEIVSPDDRISRMQRKLRDYFNFGVKYVWVIDPQERRGWIHTRAESREAVDGLLRTSDPEIVLPLDEVLPEITNA
jgi:Uma2 family endonuclease